MTKLNPYITLPGNAAEAIELYKQVFNVEPEISRFSDMPEEAAAESGMSPASPEAADRILHAAFRIGNDMLMISDAPEGQDDTVVMHVRLTDAELHGTHFVPRKLIPGIIGR
jgi:uncharacterized glyoxalase superfamily protein PhnB